MLIFPSYQSDGNKKSCCPLSACLSANAMPEFYSGGIERLCLSPVGGSRGFVSELKNMTLKSVDFDAL